MKIYKVEVTPKFRDAFSRSASDIIEVVAKDGRKAIARARREMSDRGYDRHDGGFTFKVISSC